MWSIKDGAAREALETQQELATAKKIKSLFFPALN
jgi:hypothetical protein